MKSDYQSKLIAAVTKNIKSGNIEPEPEPMQTAPAEERREIKREAEAEAKPALDADAAEREKLIKDQFDLIRDQRELIAKMQAEIDNLRGGRW